MNPFMPARVRFRVVVTKIGVLGRVKVSELRYMISTRPSTKAGY